jgi:hypothetical protein
MTHGAYVRSLGADQLELSRPARPAQLVFPLLMTGFFATAAWAVGPMTGTGLALLSVAGVLMPLLTVRAFRRFRPRRHVLVRSSSRLLLDGEPLEVARIELRVLKHWLLRRPRGYCLSLWALIGGVESLDLELGRFTDILQASQLSGQMEDFVERARARATGRAPTVD